MTDSVYCIQMTSLPSGLRSLHLLIASAIVVCLSVDQWHLVGLLYNSEQHADSSIRSSNVG